MYRDPAFQEPFSTWEPRRLLAFGRLCGRRSLQAKWAFLALLPEISLKEAYRSEGYASVYEYGAKKGGAAYREVKEVLNLHDRIGQFWVLWRLLAMGAVGMSKLLRIAPWVTPDNAAWWAEQVVKCTRAQLDALLAAMRAGVAREATEAREAPADRASGGEGFEKAGPKGQTPPVRQATGRLAGTQIGLAAMSAVSAEPAPATGSDGCAHLTRHCSSTGQAPGSSHERCPGLDSGSSRNDAGSTDPRHESIRLQMSPYGAKALRDLQSLVEQAEGPTSLGDLVGRLVVEALERASAPARKPRLELAPELTQEERGLPIEATSPPEEPRQAQVALSPRRMLFVVYRNLDTGAEWLPSPAGPIATTELPPFERDRVAAAPPVFFGELRARALAAKVRHARKLAASRKAGEPMGGGEGRHIPAAIEIYVMARSGGLCEREGCRGKVEHFHHCDPFSEHHTHDPDRMLAICRACHDGYHGGLVVPDRSDPRIWLPVSTGRPVERTKVDEACLAAKASFMEAG